MNHGLLDTAAAEAGATESVFSDDLQLAAAGTVIAWAAGISGDFATAANWSPATIPGPGNDVAIGASGAYTVSSSVNETLNSLTTAAGATLAITGGIFTISNGTGSGAHAGSTKVGAGGTLHVSGPIAGSGAVVIDGGVLDLAGSHAGTVTFTGLGGTFVGDAGNHNLAGDGQGNTLDYSNAASPVEFDLAAGNAYNNFGGPVVGVDHFSNIQIFKGGSGDDVFVGGPGYHLLDGGAGNNALDYSAATSSVQFNLAAGHAYNNFGGPAVGVDQFSSFDIFKGGSGDDVFIGGPGAHWIDGGAGNNTLDYSAAASGVQFNFATGRAYNNFGGPAVGSDQFSSFDIFKGGSGGDVFFGGPGFHSIDGGAGNNSLDYSAARSGVEFNLAIGRAYNNFGGPAVGLDAFTNIDGFKGSAGNDIFVVPGSNSFARIDGGPGFDIVQVSGSTFDLSANAGKIGNVEAIVLDAAGGTRLTLGGYDVAAISGPANALYVAGTSSDEVSATGDWQFAGTGRINPNLPGHGFNEFHGAGGSILYLDDLFAFPIARPQPDPWPEVVQHDLLLP